MTLRVDRFRGVKRGDLAGVRCFGDCCFDWERSRLGPGFSELSVSAVSFSIC